ncbi:TPR-like protein [Rhizodiscina lignyota]|uniref:TPR-like protein n=1 Tax=Rhizodiscina lignyota TaxID=1504668 RepID=A0A9P4IK95_9PEZI|nr:TPR-like protein [Rhizodiscina lignyota]
MADALLTYFRGTLPPALAESLQEPLQALENGDFEKIFKLSLTRRLLGHEDEDDDGPQRTELDDFPTWSDLVFHRLGLLLARRETHQNEDIQSTPAYRSHLLFIIALASISSFQQSNVTGPPLPFSSSKVLFPRDISSDDGKVSVLRKKLITSLSADGEAAYLLIPNVELFVLADTILDFPSVRKSVIPAAWGRLRADFLHQRLLNEVTPSLQDAIYKSLDDVRQILQGVKGPEGAGEKTGAYVAFLLERAAIHTHHGLDKKAREDLDEAANLRGFQFALTGLLGKRTKYQDRDISQLVVLAQSADAPTPSGAVENNSSSPSEEQLKPKTLDLNDDTLLESISFAEKPHSSTEIQEKDSLPPALKSLDPSNQPKLEPLDSIILLSLASSIKNTSPEDGLTREETLPYATRVLEGGSSNWQIYTQALLVRSRIEGYKTRTVERGLLQLQALVDQIIAETGSAESTDQKQEPSTTFLPRAKDAESAPVQERLMYLPELASPSRWELEAELAARWVTMGGLRTALEIYERLQMWAEVALCWAATERDDKARSVVRRQLFHSTNSNNAEVENLEDEKWEGSPREPAPSDAPRLYCILGDIDQDTAMYEKAWEVSGHRYARAQRSLGRHYFAKKQYKESAEAYEKSLKANQLNGASWFALGCALLELAEFDRAVEAFTRTVQLDDTDAEAWSNLAAALLSIDRKAARDTSNGMTAIDIQEPPQRLKDALNALKQASRLKFDNFRILDNLVTVAASTIPPSYNDVVSAQSRLIDLRGPTEGEKCIDADILELLVRHVIELDTESEGYEPSKPGLTRMVVEMVDKKVVPLITASARLWRIVARLALWRRKPSAALDAHEKAWRAVVSQPGWEYGAEEQWNGVVDATVELVDAYESLGSMERTEGLAAGSGEVVMKDWKFKARSAVRGIMGRGKGSWEDTDGWERLKDALEQLKG